MNSQILNILNGLKTISPPHKILPHQLASLEFMYKSLIDKNKNILMFHQMGSGKTIVSLLLAFLLARKHKRICIVLPNSTVKDIWMSKMNLVSSLLPYAVYNKEEITFDTKRRLLLDISESTPDKLKAYYENTVFIIDEAHNLLGNSGADKLISLQQLFVNEKNKPMFVIVTGSPITNTPLTLKDLYMILTNKVINENELITQEGNKIYNYVLKEGAINMLQKDLEDQISFYKYVESSIPKQKFVGEPIVKIPITICKMSKEQTKNYNEIKEEVTNEMFLKYLMDVSFTSMGNISNIKNFENYVNEREKYILTPTLNFNKGRFYGEELTTLKNSCKIKYFVDIKIKNQSNRCKTFIYFSNARIGGQFLEDVMKAQGVQVYGAPRLHNFLCYHCGAARKCEVCIPLTYISITSINITSSSSTTISSSEILSETQFKKTNKIGRLLDIYNSPANDNGEVICFIFGSKIISESYTLTETKDIWFLTVPDSLSEMSQITARCLRNFSYKDITKPVTINLLAAVQNDFDKNKIDVRAQFPSDIKNNTTDFIDENKSFTFDIKKILYLEIKSVQTSKIHDVFKKISVETNTVPHEDVMELFVLEVLRRIVYKYSSFEIKILHQELKNSISIGKISEMLNKFINDGIILTTKKFKQVFLIRDKNFIYTVPVFLNPTPYYYSIKL